MLFGKKKRIVQALQKRQHLTDFELLLSEYVSGELKRNLVSRGFRSVEIHVDWSDSVHCLGIQAKKEARFFDIQVDEREMVISCAEDEPEEGVRYPLSDTGTAAYYYDLIARQ